MRKILIGVALAVGAGVAAAASCPVHMKAIDDKLATAKLSDAEMAKVKQLRAEGEAQHKAGNHDASMKALTEAKKILGI